MNYRRMLKMAVIDEKKDKNSISIEQYEAVVKENAELKNQIAKLNNAVNKLYTMYTDLLGKYLNN